MKNLLKLFSLVFVFSFLVACSDDEEPKPLLSQEENFLIGIDWKSAGIYAENTLVPGTDAYSLTLNFTSTGVPGVPGAFSINGQTAPALWAYSNGTMTITYPNPGDFTVEGVTPAKEDIQATVTATQLDLFAPSTGDITFFSLITIPQSNSLRFTDTGSSVTAGSASSNLEATWSAQPVAIGVDGSESNAGNAVNMTFGSYFGINTLFVAGVPVPATWTLSSDNKTLTLNYPKQRDNASGTVQFTVEGDLASNEFRLVNDKAQAEVTLYGVITLGVGSKLVMTK